MRQENARKFGKIDRWPCSWPLTVDRWLEDRPVEEPVDRFVGAENLKRPPARFISPIFSSRACRSFTSLLPKDFLARFQTDCRLRTWFWDRFELGFWFGTQGFTSWERLLSAPCISRLFSSISEHLGFRVGGCFSLFAFLLSPSSPFVSLDGTTERDGHFQGSGQVSCWAISARADRGSSKDEVWHDPL